MKKAILSLLLRLSFFIALLLVSLAGISQRSPFRKGYLRLGISHFGSALDNAMDPLSNLSKGNWGLQTGYVLERGRTYYFGLGRPGIIKAGIDWTQLGINFNQVDKEHLSAYAASGSSAGTDEENGVSVLMYMKLGPSVSFNPVDFLVVDLRAQVMGGIALNKLNYPDLELPSDKINTVVMPSFGATVRWKFIGVAVDYMTGNPQYHYNDASTDDAKAKFKTNIFQVKLNLTL